MHLAVKKKVEQCFFKTDKHIKDKGQLIKRSDDLTDFKFEKRINPKIERHSIEYNHLTKDVIDDLRDAQEQIYGVVNQRARVKEIPF